MSKILTMTFDPGTIEHLGVRMYSTLPPVVAELVANSYDAGASKVEISLCDDKKDKFIMVEDDGMGMSFGDMDKKFLRIGRNRRIEEGDKLSVNNRKVIGKKGLGKLAFFGIAKEIEVHSVKNGKENAFLMEWEKIRKSKKREYKPKILIKNRECKNKGNGSTIILRKLQRASDFKPEDLAVSLSKIFILDSSFKISVKHNGEEPVFVENEKKYADLKKEVAWNIPVDAKLKTDYFQNKKIGGYLFAAEKPIPPKTNMRGVTLFSRKKLVNSPEYFSDSTSSHFFSYLTGWLEVDFIDELNEDVISTDRQSLNWGHPDMEELRNNLRMLLNWLEQDWRKKRSEARRKKLEKETGIPIKEWLDHVPEEIKKNLDPLIVALIKDSEMSEDLTSGSIKGLQKIIKPYPYFHWQNLHPTLHNLVFPHYKSGDYYQAVFEGVKKYIKTLKVKSGSTFTDKVLIENVFSLADPKLSVTEKYKKPDGTDFESDTVENITGGHRMLVLAIWDAFRSPLAHEVVCDLRDSGLYTEQDCLDALGVLSHLFRRLDNSETVKKVQP